MTAAAGLFLVPLVVGLDEQAGALGVWCSDRLTARLCWCAGPKMSDFRALLSAELPVDVVDLGKDVEDFAKQFPTVGFEKATMRYTE